MAEVENAVARRITLTLDMLEPGSDEMARAVRLAARLNAELEGVFIEDQDLLQLATLPFAREQRAISLASENLDTQRIERELRILARRAERALTEYAQQAGVRCSFRIWRGSLGAGFLAEFAQADVLSFGRRGVVPLPRHRPARTTAAPVAVVVTASQVGRRAMTTAINLAEDLPSPLVVIHAGKAVEDSSWTVNAMVTPLQQRLWSVQVVECPELTPVEIRTAIRRVDSPVLVVPADYPYLQAMPLRQLTSELGCQLLVVR